MRLRTHSPPNASPRMKAASISSNACVDAPTTSDEHADPDDLVDERREAGERGDDDQPAAKRSGRGVGARRRAGATNAAPSPPRAHAHAAMATAMFMRPAVSSVPGQAHRRDQHEARQQHAAAAPMLFRKYSSAMRRPGSRRDSRRMPLVISGNVVPSRIDCGRISSAANDPLRERKATRERTPRAAATRTPSRSTRRTADERPARRRRSPPRRSHSR